MSKDALQKSDDSVQLVTFGCRLNSYESEVMKSHATTAGLENTIIINTCAVTAEAERQARQSIRKMRRQNPDAKIIVTGCAVQIRPEQFAAMPEIDLLLGNHEKMLFESYKPRVGNDVERVQVTDIMTIQETAHQLIEGFEEKSRAFLQVQNGCDHRCTFCTIPFGRGNSRSVPIGVIADHVKKLIESGYQEIVFTGVDVTAYGADLPGSPTFGQMIRRVLNQNPGLKRLRLSSLDPVEIDDDLWDLIAHEERLMPHLHVSLQAGDNMILKRMKRRHLRDDAIEFCKRARAVRPNIVFGADLIAGFPTETDEMFENTMRIVDECDLTWLHVFPYSPRDGTPAARMPQVESTIRKERAARLRAKGEAKVKAYLQSCVGKETELLIEKNNIGRTPEFAEVHLEEQEAAELQIGSVQRAKISYFDGEKLFGVILR